VVLAVARVLSGSWREPSASRTCDTTANTLTIRTGIFGW
jgi:hypothetical protein